MTALKDNEPRVRRAAVLTYAGERWHGWSRPLEAQVITSVRQAVEARSDPWTVEELSEAK